MAIPTLEAFEVFLRGCHVTARQSDGPFEILSEAPFDNGAPAGTRLYLAYQPTGLSMGAALKKVMGELERQGHDSTPAIALSVLALAVTSRPEHLSAIDHLNRLLASGSDASLRLEMVFPHQATGPTNQTPRFTLGRYSADKTLYWAGRAKSTFPDDLRMLNGKFSVTREVAIRILDPGDDIASAAIGRGVGKEMALRLRKDYFHAVRDHQQERLDGDLRHDLLLLESAGVWAIGPGILDGPKFGIIYVALFSWENGRRGWAIYSPGVIFQINDASQALANAMAWFREQFGDPAITGALEPTIQVYCRFLQKAQDLRVRRQTDESFLHFVIALDLLLGENGSTTERVASRTALLVHRPLSLSLNEAAKAVRKLYDVRSRYVHSGKAVSASEVEKVEEVCVEVLWALMGASRLGEVKGIEHWQKQIDFLISTIEAERTPNEADCRAVGLEGPGVRRVRPAQIVPKWATKFANSADIARRNDRLERECSDAST